MEFAGAHSPRGSPTARWFTKTTHPFLGELLQLDPAAMEAHLVDAGTLWRCASCRSITSSNVRGVCPTYRCDGRLDAWAPPTPDEDEDHYRTIYRQPDPIPLSAKEHTAQWTTERAAEIQQDFIEGRTNVLSCSTTFELGVDLGEVEAVLLRNVPPSPGNYVQRAGRAGRRTDSAALVVTYAQRRSHDLTAFAHPERMISAAFALQSYRSRTNASQSATSFRLRSPRSSANRSWPVGRGTAPSAISSVSLTAARAPPSSMRDGSVNRSADRGGD